MATKLQVISKALVLLGQSPISSLNDNTRNARAADAIFDLSRQTFLARTFWKFALTEVELAQVPLDGTERRIGFGFSYQLPVDLIRAVGNAVASIDFQIAADRLYTSASQFSLLYVRDAEVDVFPPYAADAFSYWLAKELALTVTEDDTRKDSMRADAEVELARAMSVDATIQSNWDLALERAYLRGTDTRF